MVDPSDDVVIARHDEVAIGIELKIGHARRGAFHGNRRRYRQRR
jgi:hypothetical protein